MYAITIEIIGLRSSDPSYFRCETFNVILLSLEYLCGHKHWEISVLNTKSFAKKKIIVNTGLDLSEKSVHSNIEPS